MGHDHDHGHHGHGHHGHSHAPSHGRAFAISLVLNIGFVVTEVVYGLMADSMALVADAAHNLGDVLGLALAWGATRLVKIEPCDRRTYGWRKSTVLAAVLNATLILVAVGGVAWEAVGRIAAPVPVDGWTVVAVAAVGVAVNGVSAALFFAGRKHDANIRGAFLHLATDAAVSVGVVLAGALVLTTGWHWVDPATSLIVSVIVVAATWGLLRESVGMLMDAVPGHIDLKKVRDCMCELPGVADVHDLHVWAMSTNETSLTAHVAIEDGYDAATLLLALEAELRTRFEIGHTTVQLEPRGVAADCDQGRAGHL
ncbi:MAG: cation transporter [Nannocystaceae bacterium]|nr:cation transporter [Nannocystaceae bacterium]